MEEWLMKFDFSIARKYGIESAYCKYVCAQYL